METDDASPIREQLTPDEHLLWSGRPRQGVTFRTGDLLLIPFSVMWGGFAVFWEWSVIRIDAPIIFKLWGIPFVLVGLYLVVGRFFADAYRRANTYYGVSTQRVLIITRGVSGKVKSLNLKGLSDMSFSVSSSGPGVIQFGSTPSRGSTLLGSSGWPGLPSPPMFELAEETHRVYDLIRQAQQKAA